MSGYSYTVTRRVAGLAQTEMVPGGMHNDWYRIDGGPMRAWVQLGEADDGRLVCRAVHFDGQGTEITARLLREMPLGELVAAVANAPGETGWTVRHYAVKRIRRARPGPGGYPPEHYEQVADLYRQALKARPRAPMAWLREQLHTSEPTARRWVQRARDRGLLGASTPGKAGEQPREEGQGS